jgi:hypothetical protein
MAAVIVVAAGVRVAVVDGVVGAADGLAGGAEIVAAAGVRAAVGVAGVGTRTSSAQLLCHRFTRISRIKRER